MFLGISGNNFCMSAEAFTPPIKKMELREAEKLTSRIKLNLSFFLTNYALGTFLFMIVLEARYLFFIVSLSFHLILRDKHSTTQSCLWSSSGGSIDAS